ncbi:MAG: PEGA domain-containing protein [Candidatus Omnitrophota bacterium]
MKRLLANLFEKLTFQNFRRACFIFFILLYLVLCPLILLYSFGYIFHPEKQELVRTGLVSVETFPSGADLYLGSSRFTKKTPAVIPELLPGRYTLKVFLKNYRPWMRAFQIKPGLATAFEDILLIPKTLPLQTISRQLFKEIIPLEDQDSFILNKGQTLGDLFVFDTDQLDTRPLVDASAYPQARLLDIFSLQEAPAIIARVSFQGKNKYLLLDLEQKTVTDISPVVIGSPQDFFSVPDDPRTLFALIHDRISMINPQEGSLRPDLAGPVKGFGVSSKRLYLLKQDNTLISNSLDLKNPQPLLDDPVLADAIFSQKDFYEIHNPSPDLLVFLGKKGELIVNSRPYRACDKGCLGFSFDPRRRRLLFWTRRTITILNLVDSSREETDFSGTFFLSEDIFREGRDIQQCFWAYDGSHVLFKDAGTIYLLELDPEGAHQLELLTEAKRDARIFYSETTGTIVFLEEQDHSLKSLQLWPGAGFIPPLPSETAPEGADKT